MSYELASAARDTLYNSAVDDDAAHADVHLDVNDLP